MELFQNIVKLSTIEGTNPFSSDAAARSIWQRFIKVADTYNEPGRFSAMTGFEWTSTPKGDNLHRVVMFADGADKTSQILPFSMFDSEDPEDLWKFLAAYEAKTGGRAIAPAHNGNISNGLMFLDKTFKGAPLTRAYAEARLRWEPLYEVTQIKGDGETHPLLSPEDEFADYETWDVSNGSSSARNSGSIRLSLACSARRTPIPRSPPPARRTISASTRTRSRRRNGTDTKSSPPTIPSCAFLRRRRPPRA